MDWSMMPQGAPAKLFSARWHSRASSRSATAPGLPADAMSARAVATSTAAELDSPPPKGTSESSSTSVPLRGTPASSSSAATPTG